MVATSIDAGKHLRHELRRLGLTQVALSKAISVSRQTISNILRGNQAVSQTMARKLAKPTGRTARYWLRDEYPAPQEVRVSIVKLAKSSEVGPTTRKRRPWEKRTEKLPTFRSFILKLKPVDEGSRNLIAEIKLDREFPQIITWADLRFQLNRLGASDEYLIAARALWKKYDKFVK